MKEENKKEFNMILEKAKNIMEETIKELNNSESFEEAKALMLLFASMQLHKLTKECANSLKKEIEEGNGE